MPRLHEHGLAVPFGDAPSVGLGGITLGGGIGWLARNIGLTIDNLLGVEIVTADGRLVTATELEHPDRSGPFAAAGGNFGVVTRFHYRLQPVETALGGLLILPATAAVIKGVAAIATAAPDELTTISTTRVTCSTATRTSARPPGRPERGFGSSRRAGLRSSCRRG